MTASSQPISIAHSQRSGAPSSHNPAAFSPSLSHIHSHNRNPNSSLHPNALPSHSQASLLAQNPHFANPRWAGTSPRSAESSTSWAIHPGPLFVSAGSLGSTSGSLGAASMSGSAGSYRNKMYTGCSPAASLLNPLDPEFKFRGIASSVESDHGSLINAQMSEREVQQYRDFTCCGLPLTDLHALVEHFETNHVFVVDPLNPQHQAQMQAMAGASTYGANMNSSAAPTRSSDSSLAGALGPSPSPYQSRSASTSSAPSHSNVSNTSEVGSGSAQSAFDLDDMELDMEMEMDLEVPTENRMMTATSPAPSASSSSNPGSNSSTRSSPLGGVTGPLPLTQPQRFVNSRVVNANSRGSGVMTNGTRSSVSSPPDTPLLTTPVSPFAGGMTQPTFPWTSQAQDGLTTPMAMQPSQGQSQTQPQTQQPAGPSAFDTVHLPPKHALGGMFSHPYAGAAVGRRHPAHPLSPLSSTSSVGSGSGTTSPSSASASAFGYPANGLAFPGANGHSHPHALHHTQSLYALRMARHAAAEREREELVARALNGYAGYEDYSRGFPGTGDARGSDVGIAGAGMDGGMGDVCMGMGRMGGVGLTESAIHPGLLFGNVNGGNASSGSTTSGNGQVTSELGTDIGVSACATPAQSRSGSPSSSGLAASSTAGASGSGNSLSGTTTGGPTRKIPTASTTLSRPSSSLLLSKPFKCPTPGCTKSYKQANGLKYHVTHGQCSFTPPPELSSISELGLSIGLNLKLGPMGLEGLEGMSEKERRDAEREAERRLRPFCCQVKPCTRRYKNMNGLRYHYQHSGEHGAVGLRMLASGRHDATRSQSIDGSEEEDEGEVLGQGQGQEKVERGRAKEREWGRARKEGGQTSSAPSTPGPRSALQSQNQSQSPFSTQVFAFHHQQQQQQHHIHQRSLSGSGTGQPLSPLSQHFSASQLADASGGAEPPTPTQTQAQAQFASAQQQQQQQTQNRGAMGIGMGMGMHHSHAFAVQSQPASAYASPWGSRAGSPTGINGQWGSDGNINGMMA